MDYNFLPPLPPKFRIRVLPFQSGIVTNESKELTLNLATFFESGPSIKIAYRPNDAWNPFSLVVKTGTGSFGSPILSSMLMSAEFNLLARGRNPSFMLHFKPQFYLVLLQDFWDGIGSGIGTPISGEAVGVDELSEHLRPFHGKRKL